MYLHGKVEAGDNFSEKLTSARIEPQPRTLQSTALITRPPRLVNPNPNHNPKLCTVHAQCHHKSYKGVILCTLNNYVDPIYTMLIILQII